MYLLFESIKIENNLIINSDYHIERMIKSVKELFNIERSFNFDFLFSEINTLGSSVYKLRIIYNKDIIEYEIEKYKKRKINTLKIVNTNNSDIYSLKFLDRKKINELYNLRDDCDDILIVSGDYILDSSIANLVFYNGFEWHTPTSYLLNGTKRQFLLNNNIIKEKNIRLSDLKKYKSFQLINAMLDFDRDDNILDINNIIL